MKMLVLTASAFVFSGFLHAAPNVAAYVAVSECSQPREDTRNAPIGISLTGTFVGNPT